MISFSFFVKKQLFFWDKNTTEVLLLFIICRHFSALNLETPKFSKWHDYEISFLVSFQFVWIVLLVLQEINSNTLRSVGFFSLLTASDGKRNENVIFVRVFHFKIRIIHVPSFKGILSFCEKSSGQYRWVDSNTEHIFFGKIMFMWTKSLCSFFSFLMFDI